MSIEDELEKGILEAKGSDDESIHSTSLPAPLPVHHHDRPSHSTDIEATPAMGSNIEDVLHTIDSNRGRGRQHSAAHEAHHSNPSSRSSSRSSQDTAWDDLPDPQIAIQRSRSRGQTSTRAQSSVRSIAREAIPVPRSERRGLLARFALVGEISDPYAYSRGNKWLITLVAALGGAAAPMGSSLILPALADIAAAFGTAPTVVNLSVALYLLSMSIFPLYWSTFSESFGRRTVYLVSFAMFCVFNVLAAVSVDIGMFIVMRMLSGGAAASVQAVGAGTIADIWEVRERGTAMGIFYLGPLCGPLISPILGGVLAEYLGWRSTQWFLAIFGLCLVVFIGLCLPETLRHRKNFASEAEREAVAEVASVDGVEGPVTPETVAKSRWRVRAQKYLVLTRRYLVDPLRIILYLQFPAVALTVFYSSFTYGTLYMLNISVQQTFSTSPYNYSSIIVGLLYLPNSAGYFFASIFGGRWVDSIMHREAVKAGRLDEKGRVKYVPEDRMKENAWLGAVMWPLSIIWYAWTSQYGINLAAPMVANFFFGVGGMLIFGLVTTMLTEFMPKKPSHGVALNNFCRNIWACVGVVVTEPLIRVVGNGWLFTFLGVLAIICGCATIYAVKKVGPKWRVNMDAKMNELMDR